MKRYPALLNWKKRMTVLSRSSYAMENQETYQNSANLSRRRAIQATSRKTISHDGTHTVEAQGSTTEGNFRNQEIADDTTSTLLQSFTFYFLHCCLMLIAAA
mmetsp:Transcript_2600/g.3967  ORF Transcript_2600/g.3967 Transcript_2600/m.3967 type:complete len:102 (+) Transcript_2600:1300-1605(+)